MSKKKIFEMLKEIFWNNIQLRLPKIQARGNLVNEKMTSHFSV